MLANSIYFEFYKCTRRILSNLLTDWILKVYTTYRIAFSQYCFFSEKASLLFILGLTNIKLLGNSVIQGLFVKI